MTKLEYLDAFLAVAELGSFTEAAKHMSASKGMVSRHIEKMEESVGAKLFHRTTRMVSLTEAGQILLVKAQSIRATATEADIAIQSTTREVGGELKVAAPAEFALVLCREVIPRLRTLYPELAIRLDASPSLRNIEAGEYDVALRAQADLPGNV
ncbi:MAG: LysR family transcriptional regulator, partial [Myxococcota bacterium]